MKLYLANMAYADFYVTPFVGVWIETSSARWNRYFACVTPFVGVWIETV